MAEEQDHLSSKDTGDAQSSPSDLNRKEEFNPNEPTVTFGQQDESATKSVEAMPSHLGRYEIHGLLGSGSFGEVYLGVDTQLGRKVAIKVPRHMASGVQHEAFMREARRIAQLRHPSIVSVFDVGEFQGRCYIVSDYLSGCDLSEWMTREPYSWKQAVRIISQLADALAHAHKSGTVHRDIKPSNILITDEGLPVLLDFGLAISDEEGRELPGTIAGTPAYMSPEQIQGKAHRIDGRTDLFSLGVLLYQLLAGKKPFRSENLRELMRQITDDDPQPLRQINPQLPEQLDTICNRAMAKKAARRYQTASDLVAALEQVLATFDKTEASTATHSETLLHAEGSSGEEPSTTGGRPGSTRRIYQAERRQVTGLYVQLDDELLTSGDLDPEEFREIVQEVNKVCSKIATDHSGHIGQSSSEGMLVYFGYPLSFEGVQRRALTAGLEMVASIAALMTRLKRTKGVMPDFAVGVYSGTVVAEDTGSSESFSRYSIIGNVSKLAASVAELADPGTLAASEQVYRVTSDQFEFEQLDRELPGKTASRERSVYRVIQELAALDLEHVTRHRIVGRDNELGMLGERWQLVKEGHGQVVLIGAEPGVGKSRLLEAFRNSVDAESAQLIGRCSPFHRNTALYPIVSVLEQLLQSESQTEHNGLQAMEAFCDRLELPRQDAIPLLSELLSIPMGGQYRIFEGTPERRKQQTLELVVEIVLLLSEHQPVLFLVEDLHWIDPTTQEFLSLLLDHTAQMPCLLVLSYRPEYVVPWPSRPNQTQFMLSQFNEAQTRELVESIAEGQQLPDAVLGLIFEKTDGVPLFIEEMTKAIIESDALELDHGEYRLKTSLDRLAIPTTLQDSLMARLDRLGGAKEIAQLGAILGREFNYKLIQAVAPLDEDSLQHELKALVDAELLYQRGFFPRSRFTFKHALVQDVAYDSLLRKTRQEWHGRIAQVLEADFPQVVESEPELLAHHFGEAGHSEQAAEYWYKAGVRAQDQSALAEALQLFRKGLEQVDAVEDETKRQQLEFQFQIPLGVTLLGLQGYASPDVGPVFERANELAVRFGGVFERFHILWGTWAWRVVREELDACMELSGQAESLIAEESDDGLKMEALFISCLTRFYKGEFAESLQACRAGIALYDQQRCQLHAKSTGQNSGATHRCYGALSLWHLGYPEQALKMGQDAVDLAREIEHPFSLAYALHHLGWLQQHLRNAEEVLAIADETGTLATEQGFIFWIAESHLCRGYGLLLQDRLEEAEAEMQTGLNIFEQSGAALSLAHFYATLAEIRRRQGDVEQALEWIRQAHRASGRFGNVFHLAEIHRCHAEILLPSSRDQAEHHLEQSLEVARRQGALSPELRCTVTLARLRQQQNRIPEAVTMLEEVRNQFREGFDTPDIQDAELMLRQFR